MNRLLHSVSLLLCAVLTGCATPGTTSGTPETPLQRFNDVMAQERRWAGLETREVAVDGLTITYSVGGPEDGPAVVLLHGLAADRNHWNRVAKRLARRYRVYIPDLPGHGATPALDDPSFTKTGGVLNGFVDTLQADRVHVAGHSLGGAHAIRLAITRMSRVASLVLVNSAGVYVDNPSAVMKDVEQGGNPFHVTDLAGMDRLFHQVSEVEPFVPDDLKTGWLQNHVAHQANYQATLDAMRDTSRHFTPEAFRANLRFIRAPVMFLWGEEDKLFPLETLQQLEDARPGAETVRLPGVGHMPLFEAPHMSALAITRFIDANQ